MSPSPRFIPHPQHGSLFALMFEPATTARLNLLILMPLGDEMNKSRRAVNLAARGLAALGVRVLLLDPTGCGDSWGDFEQLSWTRWLDDLCVGVEHLLQADPDAAAPLALWAVRSGTLPVAHVLERLQQRAAGPVAVAGLLLWQPVAQGKVFLNQLARLRTAGLLTGSTQASADSQQTPKACWDRGEAVEIAGYAYSAELAQGLERAEFRPIDGIQRLIVLEADMREQAALSPATARLAQAWGEAGAKVDAVAVAAPSYWMATEIEDCPLLVAATVELVRPWLAELAAGA